MGCNTFARGYDERKESPKGKSIVTQTALKVE